MTASSTFVQDDRDGLLSPEGDGSSVRRANALSARISTVLSTSYADTEIRQALRLFELRQTQGGSNASYGSSDLKALAEKEVVDSNAQVVDDFGHVAAQLRRVGSLLAKLNDTCDSMRLHILAAKQESNPVLEEASTLLHRRQESSSREQLLQAFQKHFILSNEDVNLLTSSAQPLTEDFYTILTRVKRIHKDCEILLGQENQRLGLELMEQTTRHLDAAYKKLYTWLQREFKGIDLEDPHISGNIRRALRTLAERPTLFQNCLDFFAQAREVTLSESFQAALTGSGGRQAIEFSTHDPLRYVGDMLAWVHSAAVSEKEALEGLFVSDDDDVYNRLRDGRASEPWARMPAQGRPNILPQDENAIDDEQFDGRKALANLIGRNMASVCQTLRQRIDLAIRNSGNPVLTYKVYNLLLFYDNMFSKLLQSETSLNSTLQELQRSTMEMFETTVEQEISSSVASVAAEADLSAPPVLQTVLKQFTDICRSRGPQMDERELEHLFSTMLARLLDGCAEAAVRLQDLQARNVFKANYLFTLRSSLNSALSHVPYVSIPLGKVTQELSTTQETLTSSLTTTLLDESGVNALLQEADTRPDPTDRWTWFRESLPEAGLVLNDFLASGFMDAQDAFAKLSDKSLAKDIVTEAMERFCGEFDELEGMIAAADQSEGTNGPVNEGSDNDEASGQVPLRDLYPRTGSEVRALLS
ncbi:Conserved oligomeric Golgi complex subunit 6 [Cyphellophora attinorum]|uniref:Conserved oligomeric Golgi complex subunit 6 n=1 Tax=Cyphellophora attinorum TaxID=1664694 RepID=A0A0N1H873_9EURO|nr:Conserved oligomeric Golgi complex subunit 6 [Phialophora attinorum]KPI42984.1 Conserved oligomeric Golgi complex subunit 6 [Phialophora attinorum]